MLREKIIGAEKLSIMEEIDGEEFVNEMQACLLSWNTSETYRWCNQSIIVGSMQQLLISWILNNVFESISTMYCVCYICKCNPKKFGKKEVVERIVIDA